MVALRSCSKFFEDSYAIADLGNQQEEQEGRTEDKPLVFNELEQYVFETFALFTHTG